MIPKLGRLARGFQEVAHVEGPIGTVLVDLPGILGPEEWDPKRYRIVTGGDSVDAQCEGACCEYLGWKKRVSSGGVVSRKGMYGTACLLNPFYGTFFKAQFVFFFFCFYAENNSRVRVQLHRSDERNGPRFVVFSLPKMDFFFNGWFVVLRPR